jgi:hypothetical protein
VVHAMHPHLLKFLIFPADRAQEPGPQVKGGAQLVVRCCWAATLFHAFTIFFYLEACTSKLFAA